MKIKSKSLRKKSVAVLAGLAIAGTVGASAASLGGLNSDNLGADNGVVASCDTNGIDVDYDTAWDAAFVVTPAVPGVGGLPGTPAVTGAYVVTSINLSDVDVACNGQTFDVTALDAADLSIFTDNGTLVAPAGTASIATGSAFSASDLEGLALTISG